MFKVNNRSNRHCSGVFTVDIEFTWHVSSVFLAEFEHENAGWNSLLT